MAKKSKAREAEKGGGLCCDHCSDSKFPCVHMEKRMRREEQGSPQGGAEAPAGGAAEAEG